MSRRQRCDTATGGSEGLNGSGQKSITSALVQINITWDHNTHYHKHFWYQTVNDQ